MTHVLFGALSAAAVMPGAGKSRKELYLGMSVAATAAIFPDIDYLGFWLDPLVFLADWHRTATHSILLMPLWAGMLGSLFMLFPRARARWRIIYGLCALGISSHILLDLLTPFGIRIFYPLSPSLYSFDTTFVIDLVVTTIVALTLWRFLRRPRRSVALIGMLLLLGYWGSQWFLKTRAEAIAATRFPVASQVHALPQPFSPFYWKLIHQSGEDYDVAYLSLLAGEEGLFPPYRGADALLWDHHELLGSNEALRPLVRQAWEHPLFARFRAFARFPLLHRVEQQEGETCAWFTDMRYALPFAEPSFRYGMCRDPDGIWQLYRLRRFTDNERQLLPR